MRTTAHRIKKLQKELRSRKIPAFLVTDLTNIGYLTGQKFSAALLLVFSRSAYLFVDARYSEMAATSTMPGLKVLDPSKFEKSIKGIRSIRYEADHVTVARLARWESTYKNKNFIQISGLVEGLRREKDSSEIRKISQACRITKNVLGRIPKMFRYGMTEKDLAQKIVSKCEELGSHGMAFETIVAFGEHTSRPHHQATDRVLKKGDLVQIDMGARYEGYCSDYSRVFATAPLTQEQSKAMRALQKAKKSAEKILAVGTTNRELDRTARQVLKTYGYDKEFSHSLGHGLGLDIHEGVVLSSKAPLQKLRRNEVVTIEPGLYFAGKWGMRIEDTYIVD